jgi:hypothetical protein
VIFAHGLLSSFFYVKAVYQIPPFENFKDSNLSEIFSSFYDFKQKKREISEIECDSYCFVVYAAPLSGLAWNVPMERHDKRNNPKITTLQVNNQLWFLVFQVKKKNFFSHRKNF